MIRQVGGQVLRCFSDQQERRKRSIRRPPKIHAQVSDQVNNYYYTRWSSGRCLGM